MRFAIAIPLLLLGACNVAKDDANDTTTVSFDQQKAENTLDTIGDEAQNAGAAIVNDVKETGDTVKNEVGDVNVKVDTDGNKAN